MGNITAASHGPPCDSTAFLFCNIWDEPHRLMNAVKKTFCVVLYNLRCRYSYSCYVHAWHVLSSVVSGSHSLVIGSSCICRGNTSFQEASSVAVERMRV